MFGLVRFDGQPISDEVLRRMGGALHHRGPEGHGIRLLTAPPLHVGLGHTRLKIIDLSDQAAQPMGNETGQIWVTFNGEMYNYRELRARLQARGMTFRTTSDTEVLLRLYEAEGESCLEQLDGMFAFAVWDGRRRCLVLARDRVGKKPLFYALTPHRFAFASEAKALFQNPEIEPVIDEAALPAFFMYGYVPAPSTLYRGIKQLPAGHRLILQADGGLSIRQYWDIPLVSAPRRGAVSWAEARARVRHLVTEAVRRRLIADVPLGAFLSGGIDSSIVVGVMSQLMDQPVRTFSIGFAGDRRFDETHYARLVAQRFKTHHTEFIVEPSSIELVDRLVWHHDGPFADSSAIPTYLLSQLTRQHVTVALNGDGGDELFAGYLRFPAALLAERLPRWVWRSGRCLLDPLPSWGHPRSPWNRLKRFADSASRPLDERYSRWVGVFYDDLPCLLKGESDGALAREALALTTPYLHSARQTSELTQLLYWNLKTYLLDDLLVKMDRCAMAHALEARSPFLDRQLMEYVFSLPDEMKLRWGRTKVILRKAFADLLPTEILQRGKMGFGVPLQAWFRTDLRDYLHDVLLAPDARLRRYVNHAYVRELCQAHLAGRTDQSARLWTLITFEVWLRQLQAHAPVEPPSVHAV